MGILDLPNDPRALRAWQAARRPAEPGTRAQIPTGEPPSPLPDAFDHVLLTRRFAEVIDAILPELDPAGARLYLELFWRSYGHGTDTCTATYEDLAAVCHMSWMTALRHVKQLARRGFVHVQNPGATGPRVYRVRLSADAKIHRYWSVPREWDAVLSRGVHALTVLSLQHDDLEDVRTVYRGLDPRLRERVHQHAIKLMREAGWSAPEHATDEDLAPYRLQAVLDTQFGEFRRGEMLARRSGET